MTFTSYSLPEVVDLRTARMVADDLLRHILASPTPSVNAAALRRGGVPLLQILVAARRHAEAQGKPFAVEAGPDSSLAGLLSTFGLDPAQCGAPPDLVLAAADHPTQRT